MPNESSPASQTLSLSSATFEDNDRMPEKYTCDAGSPPSPPLIITGVPEGAKSLVLIMDDPDIPDVVKQSQGSKTFDHWVVYNIPVTGDRVEIKEGEAPAGALQGLNSAGKATYTGPCPPKQYEPKEHRYFFALYALDTTLTFSEPPTKLQVEEAMRAHILSKAKLVARYSRV